MKLMCTRTWPFVGFRIVMISSKKELATPSPKYQTGAGVVPASLRPAANVDGLL